MQLTQAPFPRVYSDLPLSLLLHSYREGPARIHAAFAGLTDDQLEARPIAGKWSVKEILIHTTESELLGAIRLRTAYAAPGSNFVMYDQDLWATELRYNAASRQELADSLAVLTALRSYMSRLFSRVQPDEWDARGGFHPEFGEITMRNLLELYADHAERHVEQILVLRRMMNTPVDIPLLLPNRLY
jgi:uncharacterized damage-inducible protein DinB